MCSNRTKYCFVILLALTAIIATAAAGDKKPAAEPSLYIASGQPNSIIVKAEKANLPRKDGWKIVVVTHGWFERDLWPKDLALMINDKVDNNDWLCAWFDWRKEAQVLNPRDAAQYARDKGGPLLAEKILKLLKNPQHIHLIGHSAGSWAISEAAKILAKQTKANIHLTFLDAYVPLGWDANELGNISNEPNRVYWADHYLTQDITLNVTNRLLLHAHNVDIGEITPGLKDHKFPYHWYPATVLGKYAPKDKYSGKKLYCTSGDVEYGFARCLEAGENNWQQSLKLPMGNESVNVEKPKEPQ
ncbi:MAG: alpha/beta hydrolase [Sedimentisphaerales bacterium]|nr:alpha/beta hydrolase [Sedimentisphaerales bacterium]